MFGLPIILLYCVVRAYGTNYLLYFRTGRIGNTVNTDRRRHIVSLRPSDHGGDLEALGEVCNDRRRQSPRDRRPPSPYRAVSSERVVSKIELFISTPPPLPLPVTVDAAARSHPVTVQQQRHRRRRRRVLRVERETRNNNNNCYDDDLFSRAIQCVCCSAYVHRVGPLK